MGGTRMLIAQISDLHIGFDRTREDEPNLQRLTRVIDRLLALDPLPDLLIATGDLTEYGDEGSYRMLAGMLARCPMPVRVMPGNHDSRVVLASVFPGSVADDGFCHHVLAGSGIRLILLDTLEEGRHGGAFCEARAAWLAERLAEAPDTPTLLFLHHPPQSVGIAWMDPSSSEPWIARLAGAVAGHDQIVALACGHVHRPVQTVWEGQPLIVCPSTAPEVGLVLAPIDPDRPDDRALIDNGAPGFALHRWDGNRLVTHFGTCPDTTLARFDAALQPMIAGMMAERAG